MSSRKTKKPNKHTFYCEMCKSPCTLYKKGKGHRVLICPRCGVLATNGLGTIIGGAIGSIVPGAGTVIGAGVGTAVEGLLKKKPKEAGKPTQATPTAPQDNKAKYAYKEFLLREALYGGGKHGSS